MTITFWPLPGSVVYGKFGVVFRHYGIVSDRWIDGKPTIIANALKTQGVREIQWDDFAENRRVYLDERPSNLPGYLVVQRARSLIGRPYHLTGFNCEHLVRLCHGKAPRSAQVTYIGLAAFVTLSAFAANASSKA